MPPRRALSVGEDGIEERGAVGCKLGGEAGKKASGGQTASQRLGTMAHFWKLSVMSERLQGN